ncbi:diacylglycerol kinase family protein [Novosphingobium sp. 1949]|uniref:Diacylglycerol kinase family protein n=1 Tax=Novosphingobium organovorum TaxID=2930092 RepID=A0ABT0BH92_9SPHN|nr:diacylglycerol kinase family protein [Novosphingobium organovorum]MCJ2184447.1 diacylglycerol kinase family protein [Novosphingobium organovorum]
MPLPPETERTRPRFALTARLKSVTYAARGLRVLLMQEHNAWLHLAATIAVIACALVLNLGADDWRWLVLAIALVWFAEAVNTAIEALCDRICPAFDPAIGRIKDIAAGAVLIAALAAGAIGLLTLGPPLLARLG